MDLKLPLPLVGALAGGAFTGLCIGAPTWSELKSSLLPAFTVIGAAVLVRLARGLPISSAENFELDEVRAIASGYLTLSRYLRALILVVLATMAWIGFGPMGVLKLAPTLRHFHLLTVASSLVSASVGGLITYCGVRMAQVVQQDVVLTRLQGELLERAVQRRIAKNFEQSVEVKSAPIAGRAGFGQVMQ